MVEVNCRVGRRSTRRPSASFPEPVTGDGGWQGPNTSRPTPGGPCDQNLGWVVGVLCGVCGPEELRRFAQGAAVRKH